MVDLSLVLPVFVKTTHKRELFSFLIDRCSSLASFVCDYFSWWIFNVLCESGKVANAM